MNKQQMKQVMEVSFNEEEAFEAFAASSVDSQRVAQVFGASVAADFRRFNKASGEFAA